MDNINLYTQINSLPDKFQQEVYDFIEFLKTKAVKQRQKRKLRNFGVLKGKVHIAPDFDEPLDIFNDYM
jgi:hypothetical protein